MSKAPMVLAVEYDALLSRTASLERDAARYRWLRCNFEHVRTKLGEVHSVSEKWGDERDGALMDAHVDTAMEMEP